MFCLHTPIFIIFCTAVRDIYLLNRKIHLFTFIFYSCRKSDIDTSTLTRKKYECFPELQPIIRSVRAVCSHGKIN